MIDGGSGAGRRRAGLALGWLFVLPACGGGVDAFDYTGTAGTSAPVTFESTVPHVTLGADGEDKTFVVDTGAPLTIFDTTSFPQLGDGQHAVDLTAFGLGFPSYPIVAWDVFPDTEVERVDGLLGGDLLRHFAFSLDYQGGRGWLFDGTIALPGDLAVESETTVPIEVVGGGLMVVPGDCSPASSCGTVEVPATRVVTRAVFEDGAEPVWIVVDTGASAVVLSQGLFDELDARTGGRPRLAGVTVSTVDGATDAFLSRVWRVRLAGLADGDPDAALDDVPVLVLAGSAIFPSIGAEVGHPVVALVGGTALRYFMTTVDYQQGLLRLSRYTNPTHVSAREFVRPGFALAQQGADYEVVDVYLGTDADAKGIVVGDVIEEIAGMPISGQPPSVVDDLLAGYALGDEVPFGVQRGGMVVVVSVNVEDLLPEFPPPG